MAIAFDFIIGEALKKKGSREDLLGRTRKEEGERMEKGGGWNSNPTRRGERGGRRKEQEKASVMNPKFPIPFYYS